MSAFRSRFMDFPLAMAKQQLGTWPGRPRPDMLNRCLPYPGSHDRAVYGLSTVDICTQTNMIRLNDGFKSFPSGHSSRESRGLRAELFGRLL